MHRSKNICQHELAAIREDAALPEVALGPRSAPCPTAVGSIRPLISKLPRRECGIPTPLAVAGIVRWGIWQLDIKNRPMRMARRGPKLTAMRFDNRTANRKPHSHALRLRRKERIENVVDVFWIDPRT